MHGAEMPPTADHSLHCQANAGQDFSCSLPALGPPVPIMIHVAWLAPMTGVNTNVLQLAEFMVLAEHCVTPTPTDFPKTPACSCRIS
jgi:hypothetical protein